jgi:hypothetical protein
LRDVSNFVGYDKGRQSKTAGPYNEPGRCEFVLADF